MIELTDLHSQTGTEPYVDQPVPKLLLVTYFAPFGQHGGQVCVERLLRDYPREKLVWMHHNVHPPNTTEPDSSWSGVERWPVALLKRPNRWGLHHLREYGNWTFHARRIARRVAMRAKKAGIEAVFGVGPGVSVWTSHRIAQHLGVPLHLWIHDDPVAYAQKWKAPRPIIKQVRRCFIEAYRSAAERYTISTPMRDEYRQLTGRDATVLPPSVDGADTPAVSRSRSDRIRIGFAGSLVDPESWERFLLAMHAVFGQVPIERQPEITVFAEPRDVPVPRVVRECGWVRVRGWQPQATVDRELAAMDYLYLSLWFGPSHRTFVRTSFSTKFVSYLKVGAPILCHVPADSAIAEFVRRCPVGPILDSTDVATLTHRLRSIFRDEAWHNRIIDAREHALALFDRKVLARRFQERLMSAHRRDASAVHDGVVSSPGGAHIRAGIVSS